MFRFEDFPNFQVFLGISRSLPIIRNLRNIYLYRHNGTTQKEYLFPYAGIEYLSVVDLGWHISHM